MNQAGVIIALIFSLIVAIFALLNNQPVSINYFFGKVEVSSVIIILGSAFSGALIVFLLGIYRQIKLTVKVRGLNADIRELEKDIELLDKVNEELTDSLEKLENSPINRRFQQEGSQLDSDNGSPVNLGKKTDDYKE